MAQSQVSDEVWDEFHRAVNMSSATLQDWLMERGADETSEEVPDRAGPDIGRGVLAVLRKRRTDVTSDDVEVMERVIARVRGLRGEDRAPTAGDDDWRHRLMDVGHDPLQAAPDEPS